MIKYIKMKNISFKNLIRNYSKEIISIRDKILKNADININDWLNDHYNEKQITAVIDEYKKLVSPFVEK